MSNEIQVSTSPSLPNFPNLAELVDLAQRRPRDIVKVMTDIRQFVKLLRPEEAEALIYNRPVGQKNGVMQYAQGASIRMAEIFQSCYGRLAVSTQIIDDGNPRQARAQAVCIDFEQMNIYIAPSIASTVTKDKKPYSEAQRNLVQMACAAKARRDAILNIIPKIWVSEISDLAREMMGQTDVHARRKKLLDHAKLHNIKPETLCEYQGKASVDFLDHDDITALGRIFNAVKLGELTFEEAFPEKVKETKLPTDGTSGKIKDLKPEVKSEAEQLFNPADEPDSETGEVAEPEPEPKKRALTATEQVIEAIHAKDFTLAESLLEKYKDSITGESRERLQAKIKGTQPKETTQTTEKGALGL